jgi:hypothetical protein
VQDQPAFGYRMVKAGFVLRRCALEFEQKRPVDLLDIDPAVLDWLECVGELEQLAGGDFPDQMRGSATSSALAQRTMNEFKEPGLTVFTAPAPRSKAIAAMFNSTSRTWAGSRHLQVDGHDAAIPTIADLRSTIPR